MKKLSTGFLLAFFQLTSCSSGFAMNTGDTNLATLDATAGNAPLSRVTSSLDEGEGQVSADAKGPANKKVERTIDDATVKNVEKAADKTADKASDKSASKNTALQLETPKLAPAEMPNLKPLTPKLATPQDANSAKDSTANSSTGKNSKEAASPGKSDESKTPTAQTPGTPGTAGNPGNPEQENYPTVARMEKVVFGTPKPFSPIEARLSELEESIFKKQYPSQSLFDRTQRLKETILGVDDATIDDIATSMPSTDPLEMLSRGLDSLNTAPRADVGYLDALAAHKENQSEIDESEAKTFALDLINYLRSEMGCLPVLLDDLAGKLATEHASDLAKRNVVSHADPKGDNPDLRYTNAGGTDAMTESLATISNGGTKHLTKATIAKLLKLLMERQDDRESLLNPDATAIGFSAKPMTNKDTTICCCEVITKHGIMAPLAPTLSVGDHIEIKGVIQQPFHFDRVTIAWEGHNRQMNSTSDETEEALPYFPPLDYIGYAPKGEHDYEKTLATLRMVGLVAAIAGGVFVPPVALAAPLIIASGGMGSEPRPMSDIPIHGGFKMSGSTFSGKIHLTNGGKTGLYYITVWANPGRGGKSVPISRRVYVVEESSDHSGDKRDESVEARVEEK